MLKAVEHLVMEPLGLYKDVINNDKFVSFHTAVYIVGTIDYLCQFNKKSDAVFFKMCLHFFINDLVNNNININTALTMILFDYNLVTEKKYVIEIMQGAAFDVMKTMRGFEEGEKYYLHSQLGDLINDWSDLEKQTFIASSNDFLDLLKIMEAQNRNIK